MVACQDCETMFLKLLVLFLLMKFAASQDDLGFTYNGFLGPDVSLNKIAQITTNGLLMLGSDTNIGYAFYSNALQFLNQSNGTALSFSTTFVFAIIPGSPDQSSDGMAFVIAPWRGLPGALPGQYLGLFNETNVGKSSKHVIAVEFDTIQNKQFNDINDNHVGIDINDLKSVKSVPASYFSDQHGRFVNLSLDSGEPIQVWVQYDGTAKQLNVTLAPINASKPAIPLLSWSLDLSPIMLNSMYVGFSSSTSSIPSSHYVLGWSFKLNGQAEKLNLSQLPALNLSQLPALPRRGDKKKPKVLSVGLPVLGIVLMLMTIFAIQFVVRRKIKFQEVLEDWELDYGTHRFKYKDLYYATKGFNNKGLLGTGGFGSVYRGTLPTSKIEVAIKKVSHESRQGMKEFVAEIVSLGRMRHRNLVPLLGYCRRKGELLLVYDFMPNGSLDKFLFNQSKTTLNWSQRFRIIKGIASGLFYLHEEWEQVVVHRDIKSSNVLLDGEMNGRLGDFGLARLYKHGTDPHTTHMAGTIGYIAPEFTRTGKATPSTDVFSFGTFMLEVACGRKPIKPGASAEERVLADWVFYCWSRGETLETADPKLGDFVAEEMELVLKLGLLCSQSNPTARPSMRQVVRCLEGHHPVPELSSLGLNVGGPAFRYAEGFDDVAMSYPSQENTITQLGSSVADEST